MKIRCAGVAKMVLSIFLFGLFQMSNAIEVIGRDFVVPGDKIDCLMESAKKSLLDNGFDVFAFNRDIGFFWMQDFSLGAGKGDVFFWGDISKEGISVKIIMGPDFQGGIKRYDELSLLVIDKYKNECLP